MDGTDKERIECCYIRECNDAAVLVEKDCCLFAGSGHMMRTVVLEFNVEKDKAITNFETNFRKKNPYLLKCDSQFSIDNCRQLSGMSKSAGY